MKHLYLYRLDGIDPRSTSPLHGRGDAGVALCVFTASSDREAKKRAEEARDHVGKDLETLVMEFGPIKMTPKMISSPPAPLDADLVQQARKTGALVTSFIVAHKNPLDDAPSITLEEVNERVKAGIPLKEIPVGPVH